MINGQSEGKNRKAHLTNLPIKIYRYTIYLVNIYTIFYFIFISLNKCFIYTWIKVPQIPGSRWRQVWQPCCELQKKQFFVCFISFLLFYMLDVVSITV